LSPSSKEIEAEGKKFDENKTRLDLIPPEAIWALGSALSYGANKYGEYNWAKGMQWSRIFAATLRHLYKWWAGEECDAESGIPHLHHALTNIAFACAYSQRGIGKDDRPKKTGPTR
jgi:hypothetical protein